MEVDDPDSATRAQLRARELGKIEAFIPNLRPNAPVPKSMGILSHDSAPRESQCCSSSYEQSIQTNHLKSGGRYPQNGFLPPEDIHRMKRKISTE